MYLSIGTCELYSDTHLLCRDVYLSQAIWRTSTYLQIRPWPRTSWVTAQGPKARGHQKKYGYI